MSNSLAERRDAAASLFINTMPDTPARTVKITAEQHRPFSMLSWFETDDGRRFVVKVTRGDPTHARDGHEVSTARSMAPLFAESPNLQVLSPLAHYEKLGAIVTAAVDASSLGAQMERRLRGWPRTATIADLATGCALAGEWLARLHEGRPAALPWSVSDLHEDIERRLNLLRDQSEMCRMDGPMRKAVGGWLSERLCDFPADTLPCSFTHGDYSPSNMLFNGSTLTVLDFTMARDAPRLLDATRFIHQLHLLTVKPWYRPAVIAPLERAFVEGYGDNAPGPASLLPVFDLRHTLAHWLGSAKRASRLNGPRRVFALWLCRYHRTSVQGLLEGRPRQASTWRAP